MSSDSCRLKILWLKTGPLHPLDTGGKIRTYNMLRELKKRHEITYLALCPDGVGDDVLKSASEYSHKQIWVPWTEARRRSPRFFAELCGNLFSKLPYVIAKYHSLAMSKIIRELDDPGSKRAGELGRHDLIICDFLTPAINLFLHFTPKTPTLLFQHNVESQIWERLFNNARGIKRVYFHQQWKRLESFEAKACAQVDAVVGVSEDDCALLRKLFGLTNVLGAVPTGVDVEYFSTSRTATKEPRSLVFLGSMDWMPNIDGAQFFVNEILPLVKKKFPDTKLTIVGRNPPPQIKQLENIVGVHVTGTVPDVRPFLARAEVMIVPLRVGGGTRIKIFEGMAAGVPVVSTAIGAEGLLVTTGENIFLADAPEEFAARVCQLLDQPDLRARLGGNGLALVERQFSWGAAARTFENYCLEGVRKTG